MNRFKWVLQIIVCTLFTVWLSLSLFLVYYSPKTVLEKSDIIVVFGAGYRKDGRPVPALETRLQTASWLWQQMGANSSLLLSGRQEEVAVMQQYLVNEGVPSEKISTDLGGTNTAATVRRLQPFRDNKITFVSQAYHLPRIRLYAYVYQVKNVTFSAAERIDLPLWRLLPATARESFAILCFPFQRIFISDYR
ncbi:MAG: ElyC/SanA/YdcF family protein [Brevinema sp.]